MITIEQMLDEYYNLRDNARSVDKALFTLLERHKKNLPELHDPTQFHKTFRQTDVIDGTTDIVIWHLLHASNLFWTIYEELKKEQNDQVHDNG